MFLSHRYGEAISELLLAIEDEPDFPGSYQVIAACYAHLARLDEARDAVARLRAITPLVMPSFDMVRRPEDRELILSGLRMAMDASA